MHIAFKSPDRCPCSSFAFEHPDQKKGLIVCKKTTLRWNIFVMIVMAAPKTCILLIIYDFLRCANFFGQYGSYATIYSVVRKSSRQSGQEIKYEYSICRIIKISLPSCWVDGRIERKRDKAPVSDAHVICWLDLITTFPASFQQWHRRHGRIAANIVSGVGFLGAGSSCANAANQGAHPHPPSAGRRDRHGVGAENFFFLDRHHRHTDRTVGLPIIEDIHNAHLSRPTPTRAIHLEKYEEFVQIFKKARCSLVISTSPKR